MKTLVSMLVLGLALAFTAPAFAGGSAQGPTWPLHGLQGVGQSFAVRQQLGQAPHVLRRSRRYALRVSTNPIPTMAIRTKKKGSKVIA